MERVSGQGLVSWASEPLLPCLERIPVPNGQDPVEPGFEHGGCWHQSLAGQLVPVPEDSLEPSQPKTQGALSGLQTWGETGALGSLASASGVMSTSRAGSQPCGLSNPPSPHPFSQKEDTGLLQRT